MCMNKTESHRANKFLISPQDHSKFSIFFSEFNYVTHIYFNAYLFTSRKHFNAGSESLHYKAKVLRAIL